MQEKQQQNKQKVVKNKRKINKTIDCDYLMFNSHEDEEQLRSVVKDNYSNTIEIGYNSSEY